MGEEDSAVVDFCESLAVVRERFRESHLFVKRKTFTKEVTTTVSHSRGEYNEALMKGECFTTPTFVRGVAISFSLDAELAAIIHDSVINDEKYSLGASLAVRFLGDHWLLQGEVGWSCVRVGWEDYRDFELRLESARQVVTELEHFSDRLLSCYRELVNSHEAG